MTASQVEQIGGLWMVLKDRKMLAKLMAIQEISQRSMATQAGWKSHTYLGRLLKGEVTTLEPEPALRIAKTLGVGVDDLFFVRVSSNAGHFDQGRVPA